MSVAELVALLSMAGANGISETESAEDLAVGSPRNPDGSINLVHFIAWLINGSS